MISLADFVFVLYRPMTIVVSVPNLSIFVDDVVGSKELLIENSHL